MLRKVLKNFGVVLRGRGIAAVFAVAATGLMANALTATEFGLVILLHTYILVVRGAFNFRTFEAVVRYGIPYLESGQDKQLRSLLRTTMLIDFAAALVAMLIAMLAAPLASKFLHWEAGMAEWAVVYSLIIFTTANGTSSGILRIYDRFDALGVQFTVAPALRFFSVLAAWALDAPMFVFIVAWGAAFAIGNVYMFVRGLLELKVQMDSSLLRGFRSNELREQGDGFWKFITVVYWQTNIDLLPKHVSTLLAGGLLGPAAAGLFRLAREFSTVLTQPAEMLREVLFPDLARSYHAEDGNIRSVPFKAALVAGAVGLAFVLLSVFIGPPILTFIGEEYADASVLLCLLLLAATFDLASAPLRAAAYAMGKASSILKIHVLGILSYIVAFFVLAKLIGLNGPGYAAILASLLALFLTARLIKRV